MKKLNNTQKRFLFDNCYVTSKVLDACVEPGWQEYFIRSFNWLIDERSNDGWYRISIVDKNDTTNRNDNILNLRDDFAKLMSL